MGILAMREKMFALGIKGNEPVTTEQLAELETSILKQIEQLYVKPSPKDASTEDQGNARD